MQPGHLAVQRNHTPGGGVFVNAPGHAGNFIIAGVIGYVQDFDDGNERQRLPAVGHAFVPAELDGVKPGHGDGVQRLGQRLVSEQAHGLRSVGGIAAAGATVGAQGFGYDAGLARRNAPPPAGDKHDAHIIGPGVGGDQGVLPAAHAADFDHRARHRRPSLPSCPHWPPYRRPQPRCGRRPRRPQPRRPRRQPGRGLWRQCHPP